MSASNVHLILEANQMKTVEQEDKKKNETHQNKVQGMKKAHVALIIRRVQLEANNLELTSKKEKLSEEFQSITLVFFSNQ